MSIIDQLKARQAAVAAEQAAAVEADPGVFTEPTAEEKAAALAAATPPPPEKKSGPPGSYRSCRLMRFHKSSGMCVVPDADGFFIPADAEEAAILAHHATTGFDMVEFQDPEAAPAA